MAASAVASPVAPTSSHIALNLHHANFGRLFSKTETPTVFEGLFETLGNCLSSIGNEREKHQFTAEYLSEKLRYISILALASPTNECEIVVSSLTPKDYPGKVEALIEPISYIFNHVIKDTSLERNREGTSLRLTWKDATVFQPKVTHTFSVKFPVNDENSAVLERQICELPECEGDADIDVENNTAYVAFVCNDDAHAKTILTKIRTFKDFTATDDTARFAALVRGDKHEEGNTGTDIDDGAEQRAKYLNDNKGSTVDDYILSDFANSEYCFQRARDLHRFVGKNMEKLHDKGGGYKVLSHILAPFVGLGTLLTSICLRIGSIAEPIFGIFTDLGAAAYFKSPRPALNCVSRIGHIFRNAFYNGIISIPTDVIKLGLGATVGGIFSPRSAYRNIRD